MVIATVLLSVLAAVVGVTLASLDQRQQRQQVTSTPVTPVTPEVTSTGRPCRPETQKRGQEAGATGPLTQVLVLRTARSVVWICEDQAGGYYYHANRGGPDAEWIEGETALFLSGVRGQGDAWVVEAGDGTRFSVNTDRLLIIHKDGTEEEQGAA